MDFRIQIGRNLRAHREGAGMTQLALKLETGVATSEISRIETGKRDPGVGTLLRLAEGLDVRVADLVEGLP
ncbi:MAG: helix-turn-helix domain-containing protein [Thermoleophilaceae bacterium]